MSPAGLQQYQDNYYQQNINPAIQQARADAYQNGQQWGSFGGAAVGQLAAQGQLDKYNAGLNYSQQLFNNQVQGRQSYFAGGPNVAATQNAADVARGTNVAQLQAGNANALNSYNLSNNNAANDFSLQSAGQRNNYAFSGAQMANNFGTTQYQNQLQAYNLQNQQAANRTQGLLGLGQGAASLLGGPIGGMLGAGAGALGSAFGGGGSLIPSSFGRGPTFGSQYGSGGQLGGQQLNQVGSFGNGTGNLIS